MCRDLAMRFLRGVCRVEHADPLGPRATRLLADGRVAHACDLREVACRFVFLQELKPCSCVRFAGLLHAGSNEPLEVFLFRHNALPRSVRERSPPAAPSARTKVSSWMSGSLPPFASARAFAWGKAIEVGRGRAPRKTVARCGGGGNRVSRRSRQFPAGRRTR